MSPIALVVWTSLVLPVSLPLQAQTTLCDADAMSRVASTAWLQSYDPLRRPLPECACTKASLRWSEAAGAFESLRNNNAPNDAHALALAQAAERKLLENLIDEHIKIERRKGRLSPDERTAWSVYDFTTGKMLVEINTDIELQAASLIKPFLALAFMHEVDEGRLTYDEQSRRQMELMIQHSSNRAADWVMRRVGGPARVQRLLKKNYGSILKSVRITEYIPRDGRTYRNKASARDYSRFLLALWRDELPHSQEIKRLLGLPKRDRLRTGVPLPEDIQVYDKTGSTSHLCGDIGVVQARGPDGRLYAYTLVGIIEKRRPARHYTRWLESRGNIIREISGLVYTSLGAWHGFAELAQAAEPQPPQAAQAPAASSAPAAVTATVSAADSASGMEPSTILDGLRRPPILCSLE